MLDRGLVHSTAVVDPLAPIGEGVVIGPFCVMRGRVVIGSETALMEHVSVHVGGAG